jgi:hypothetical protein
MNRGLVITGRALRQLGNPRLLGVLALLGLPGVLGNPAQAT